MTQKSGWKWIVAGGTLLAAVCAVGLAFWLGRRFTEVSATAPDPATTQAKASVASAGASTDIYAHNLRLHQGPDFRVYVQWLKGKLQPSHRGVVPSFDDSNSFSLNITNGVIRANIGDICNFLNGQSSKLPFRDIKVSGTGNQVKITGTVHKIIPIPVELSGTLTPNGPNRIQLHITKIGVLRIPLKSLLGDFHVTLADLMGPSKVAGLEASDNDIFFDPEQLLPPPHIHGNLTQLTITSPDLQAVYGDATKDEEEVQQWRNFLRLQHGTVRFGKLTMQSVDLMMIDISQDAWFDLDLVNYQAQLQNGYTRMTPQQGLQIFMPDVSDLKNTKPQDISIEWFKNRNVAPPSQVVPHH